MSGTVAIDALRVDDWERKSSIVAAEAGAAIESPHHSARTCDLGTPEVPLPPWPRRKLNDALADLGPVRPEGRVAREPWSRSKMPRPEASSATAPANDDSAPMAGRFNPKGDCITESANLGELYPPPPPRPARNALVSAAGSLTSEGTIESWGEFGLAEDDSAGADIVRALAEANLAGGLVAFQPPAEVSLLDGDQPLERPPMIIERAIAEQGQGVASLQPAAAPGSPLPGLAVGFSLSLVAGAALYMMLASG